MSLLSEAMEDYTFLNKTKESDGYGGYTVTWKDGATIKGAMAYTASQETKKAEAMGVTSVYVLTTRKADVLEYHDVLRRESDKKIFRVTSDGDDAYTPASAGLDMRNVTCEEWTLPSDNTSEVNNGQGTGA